MGGHGSTRWNGYQKRQTVENCMALDVNLLCLLKGIEAPSGTLSWQTGATIGFVLNNRQHRSLELRFKLGNREIRELFPLVSTEPHLGGRRWWFQCNGENCRRRVQKMYLPPGEKSFACRQCHGLTHLRAQRHDKRIANPNFKRLLQTL